MSFTVYVLHSPKFEKIYIGFTSDLDARLLSHNQLGTKGWTIKFRPWILIHSETFESKKRGDAEREAIKIFKGQRLDTFSPSS